MNLSPELLRKLWPHATDATIAGVSAGSGEALLRYGITKLPQLSDFMAQCSEETGGGTLFVESGAYSAERAHEVWPGLFPTVQSAQAVVGDSKALFNKTYGGRLGNRPGTDDGYNFRGRGMIQITGRDWYTKIGKEIGLDLIANPDLAADPAHLLECALAFWKIEGVNALVGDFRAETKRINGGYVNMASREAWRVTCAKFITTASVNQEIKLMPGVVTPTLLPKPTGSLVTAAIVTAAAQPVSGVPTISQNTHVDIGTAIASLLHSIEPATEALANFGIKTAAADIPFGTMIVGYATNLVDQYVQKVFVTLESTLQSANLSVPAGNIVLDEAAKMFNENELALANFLGGALTPLLQAAVKKLGLPVTF